MAVISSSMAANASVYVGEQLNLFMFITINIKDKLSIIKQFYFLSMLNCVYKYISSH